MQENIYFTNLRPYVCLLLLGGLLSCKQSWDNKPSVLVTSTPHAVPESNLQLSARLDSFTTGGLVSLTGEYTSEAIEDSKPLYLVLSGAEKLFFTCQHTSSLWEGSKKFHALLPLNLLHSGRWNVGLEGESIDGFAIGSHSTFDLFIPEQIKHSINLPVDTLMDGGVDFIHQDASNGEVKIEGWVSIKDSSLAKLSVILSYKDDSWLVPVKPVKRTDIEALYPKLALKNLTGFATEINAKYLVKGVDYKVGVLIAAGGKERYRSFANFNSLTSNDSFYHPLPPKIVKALIHGNVDSFVQEGETLKANGWAVYQQNAASMYHLGNIYLLAAHKNGKQYFYKTHQVSRPDVSEGLHDTTGKLQAAGFDLVQNISSLPGGTYQLQFMVLSPDAEMGGFLNWSGKIER